GAVRRCSSDFSASRRRSRCPARNSIRATCRKVPCRACGTWPPSRRWRVFSRPRDAISACRAAGRETAMGRAVEPTSRGRLRLALILCCGVLSFSPWTQARDEKPVRKEAAEEELLRKLEKEMMARPIEAFIIARGAADQLTDAGLKKRLWTTAAEIQRRQLERLSEDQVAELAEVYAKTLHDQPAGRQIQRDWLKKRESRMRDEGPGDAKSRLHLARLVWDWCQDTEWAAQLCVEALRLDPDSSEGARMLRDKLGYERTDRGWLPRKSVAPRDWPQLVRGVHRGMTRADVLERLRDPKRKA